MTVPWPMYVLSHVPHALDLWKYESVGELGENVENAQPWWFYLPQVFLIALPWTAVWLVGLLTPWQRRRRRGKTRRLLFPALWFVAAVVFFSFVNLKKNAYLLPVMPAYALLAARGLRTVLARTRRGSRGAGVLLQAHAIAAAAGAIAVAWLVMASHDSSGHKAAAVALCALAAVVASYAIAALRRTPDVRGISATAVAFGLLLFVSSNFLVTAKDNLRSPRPAAAELTSRLTAPDTSIYHRYMPPEAAVYLPVGAAEVSDASRQLIIVGDRRVGAAPLTPADLQPWFDDRRVVAVETTNVKSPSASGRWDVVEIRTEKR
jgi:4-amino-4-deoxy-L-arabinose transferase-like glycosyltransferase